MRRSWILVTVVAAACGSGAPPPPATDGGSPDAEPITGRERLGWSQHADDPAQLATFRYAVYVDGARSEIADATCATLPEPAGFECSGSLPRLTNGIHTLELATFVLSGDSVLESARAPALRVSVTASAVPAAAQADRVETQTTRDGLTIRLDRIAEGLSSPVDAAFAPDGTLFVAERSGTIKTFVDDRQQTIEALRLRADPEDEPPQILSIAVDPDYSRTHFVFVAQAVPARLGTTLQLARYREVRGRLGERAVLLETPVPADAASASSIVRFGADGKVYVASGGVEGNGTLMRLNPDGSMPRDQSGSTPAIATGIETARGMALDPRSNILWIADNGGTDAHLSAISVSPTPVRATVRARHVIAGHVGSLEFYRGEVLPRMRGDALLASANGYILRLRFAQDDPARIESVEKILTFGGDAVRVVTVSPDGAIYFCTDSTLARLTPAR